MWRESNNHNHGFMKGAAYGAVLGSMAGLLLAPKSGKELRDDISDTYCDIVDKTERFGKQVRDQGQRLIGNHEEPNPTHFITGSLIGAAVGATAALLLAPKSGAELRRNLGRTVEGVKEGADEWKETIVDLTEKFGEALNRQGKTARSRVEDFVELANMGLNVWHNLQKRR